jgi:hypothetical protein
MQERGLSGTGPHELNVHEVLPGLLANDRDGTTVDPALSEPDIV